MKDVQDAARTTVARLEAAGVDYMLVGALAYFAYGLPRHTDDVDAVVSVSTDQLEAVLQTLPPDFHVDPQARMELFTATTRWVVNIAGSVVKVEFFLLGSDAHHTEEFHRKRRLWLPGLDINAWIATAEDLIVQKLRWARLKDLEDITNILVLQGAALDFPYIEKWCALHGTQARLDELRRSIPPDL